MKRVSAPPTLIANHLLRVDPANDPETVSLLRQAAVMAAAGGDSRSASMLMRRALEEPPPEEQLTGVLAQLGAAEMLIDGPSAIEHLGAAFEGIREPAFKVAVAELLARSLVMQERIPEAVPVTEQTLATLARGRAAAPAHRCGARRDEPRQRDRLPEGVPPALPRAARRGDTEGDDYGSRAMLSLAVTFEARTLGRNAEETVERARAAARDGVLIREGINSITQLGPPQALTVAGHYREAMTCSTSRSSGTSASARWSATSRT